MRTSQTSLHLLEYQTRLRAVAVLMSGLQTECDHSARAIVNAGAVRLTSHFASVSCERQSVNPACTAGRSLVENQGKVLHVLE